MSRILVVDDDRDFVEATRTVLEAAGYEVEGAGSAEEGLEKISGSPPDLAILDVMLPSGFEGFEVARKTREEYGLRKLPLVMLSSVHEAKKPNYRFAPDEEFLPVDVFLDKPVTPEVLLETVQELLGERREEPETPL